jgi:hypothetical protein
VSNPTQTVVIDIQVVTGTDPTSHALSYVQQSLAITGDHKGLMAAFKTSTTPAVIKALEESKLQFDAAGARLAAVKGEQMAQVEKGEVAQKL